MAFSDLGQGHCGTLPFFSSIDIDLDQTMPNAELVEIKFIYNNMFKFKVIINFLIYIGH